MNKDDVQKQILEATKKQIQLYFDEFLKKSGMTTQEMNFIAEDPKAQEMLVYQLTKIPVIIQMPDGVKIEASIEARLKFADEVILEFVQKINTPSTKH